MLKRFWEHKITHFTVVILVFSITGSSVGRISAMISTAIGLERFSLSWWIFVVLAITPLYQVLLLIVAFIFGKFNYFKEKQLKLWGRIKKLFSPKSPQKDEEKED
ncbi:MAG: prolipoprotein diacylglyceryl transferase [Bacteroidia bacterium]|nr:prolipoprotein diacylglyceryl transferase [Bacteroidia bacterium]